MKLIISLRRFFEYLKDVRTEVSKVTWPSRQEVVITAIVVFALACVCAIFFAIVDTMWFRVVHGLIGG